MDRISRGNPHKIKREPLAEQFARSFAYEYISVLVGQRQVGKTTFIQDLLKTKTQSEYLSINLDLLSEREAISKHGLEKTIETFFRDSIDNFTDTKFIFIDECQKLPNIFEEIKVIFDKHKDSRKIKFVLSGSSSLDLYMHSAESLAGRINYQRAFAFNLSETVKYNHIKGFKEKFWKIFDVDFSFDQALEFKSKFIEDKQISELIQSMTVYGSLPDVVKSYPDNIKVIDYWKNYKNTYIEKDIRSLDRIGEINLFNKVFDLLCMQAGGLLVKSNICSDLGMGNDTLESYLSVLSNTFIIDLVQPFTKTRKKRLVKSPKIYPFDTGLIFMAHGFPNLDQITNMKLIGNYFETLVYNELKKILYNKAPALEICFYRTHDDAEIDFVLDYKHKVIPVEVKWTKSADKLNLTTLKNFINETEYCDYGVVVYNGDFQVDRDNKIIFFPMQYFASI